MEGTVICPNTNCGEVIYKDGFIFVFLPFLFFIFVFYFFAFNFSLEGAHCSSERMHGPFRHLLMAHRFLFSVPTGGCRHMHCHPKAGGCDVHFCWSCMLIFPGVIFVVVVVFCVFPLFTFRTITIYTIPPTRTSLYVLVAQRVMPGWEPLGGHAHMKPAHMSIVT